MKCKHCGSSIGFYTKLKGIQYYNENAEPQGCDVYSQTLSVYCQDCDKRCCSLTEFFNQKKGGAEETKVITEKFFSPDDVRKMSPKEVRENYQAICNSMKEWR